MAKCLTRRATTFIGFDPHPYQECAVNFNCKTLGAIIAETGSSVIALAGVLLCYGSTEVLEGYGLISVAVLRLTLRRMEEDHHFHRRLHDFSESVEHALTALLLIALGSVMPIIFVDLTWTHVVLAILLILVIRPLSGWIA